ncbi:bifunctional phosphoribosylaminoimidazolecarboxamide formyltransferase/IMP cyclohydrolase [Natranaerobius thermophilus JW/NM-WN-LF]|uniref:Bifunctional purine biosynthesis protein PurH n=1 Tax=Natranaerobius thermophilus (strain ATCC BAA-1301 / DSM 18059 / JW/NM-WN-LF) TaxID=457570 RepID=PUR9_NATTJ|nr:RecName: Full=Bifunctional purine biosynthesis protein PurH; Includes: RecName: Full=Phosphoribosylaminoimidazolecarboxamide formyltransferase; AltName: Full=AICAR transformylase; Includes: RecName: Full=IMP cyclohydrolase; AltName: Full=ATIC; AltName: Full=IMP synthase; AltName: Full=Inosinicase [Natranaerobius thermophilus JW/NM-WN-LF]ACB84054.1 phosphoribosylaminoimidazolecarboxamide formyltransferase/IMP cyclohydrolase [Natranaerobius thermophilus JW/NM-WN-LF]
MTIQKINRVLLSVYDKTGLITLAQELKDMGVELVSTGGTLRHLQTHGIPVYSVEEVTGFPEILSGRVKTLHPKIHGGILAKNRENEELSSLDIKTFDLVIVNLYPFEQVMQKAEATEEEVMENIDIGGPTMIRAAAKNWYRVGVCVDPTDYEVLTQQLKQYHGLTDEFRKTLARKAFKHTAQYDKAIFNYFESVDTNKDDETELKFPEFNLLESRELPYGENPHQKASLLMESQKFIQHQGKGLSYNNFQDIDAAIKLVHEFQKPAVVAVKHTNPCGVGVSNTIEEAYDKAYQGDPVSIFGGIVACNRPVTEELASKLTEIFLDVIIAPEFEPRALEKLKSKSGTKVVEMDLEKMVGNKVEIKSTTFGYLCQEADYHHPHPQNWDRVAGEQAKPEEIDDLIIAEKIVKHVKSNAIVVVKEGQSLGIGAGQMNRVGASRIALENAGKESQNSVLASDAFFPFNDVVKLCSQYGVSAIVQPGGSKRDQDSIDLAQETGITMYFTGIRHFKH